MNLRLNHILAIAIVTPMLGAAPITAAPLTWEECVKQAAVSNPELRQSALSVRQADYGKSSAVGRFLPQVGVGASQGWSGSEASPFSGGTARDRTSTSLSISQNLFNGFKDQASLRRASAQVEIAQAQLDLARAQVSRDLKSAFYGLLYAQRQVPMLQDIADRRRENVRMVELRYKSGRENKGSFLQSQASEAQAAFEVTQAKRALRFAQRTLARVLGRSELDAIEVTGDFAVRETGATPDFKAMAGSLPSGRVAEAQLRSAESQVTSAKGEFLPTLSASGSMSRSGTDWMPDDPSWSAGLNLSLSLFSGGQDAYNLKSAKASREQARIDMTTTLEEAALKLEDAFASYQNAVESTRVQEKSLEAAQVREQIASAQYANGLMSYLDWDQIENSLIASQKSRLQGLRSAQVAEADWELAQGKGVLP